MGLIKSGNVTDNHPMSDLRRSAALLLAIAPLLLAVSCATVPEEEFLAERERALLLADELLTAEEHLAESRRTEREQQAEIAQLEAELDRQEEQTEAALSDLEAVRTELEGVRERLSATEDDQADNIAMIVRMSEQIEQLELALDEIAGSDGPEDPERSPADALSEALSGGAGFQRIARIGFTPEPRSGRLVDAPGIAVDSSSGTDVLYDIRLDYLQTMAYLTIEDPTGRNPALRLTTQYVTRSEPLWAQTAFIAIEGLDPVDPVDPIVLNVTPRRQTDGSNLVEQFSVAVDRQMVSRLSSMLSSQKFTVTFVGPTGQQTHRPSVAERAAMSNILFSFIDLGGLR